MRLEEKNSMNSVLAWMRYRLRKAKERDRRSERYFEAASRFLWRWSLPWLVAFAGFVALLDYGSTYAVLELSGKRYLNEGGPLASWALEKGGFAGLSLADLAAVTAISIAAVVVRFIFLRFGFPGFGRAASVFLLVPYVVMALVAVVNNMVLAYL
jgi:hypothetical protein